MKTILLLSIYDISILKILLISNVSFDNEETV